MSQRDLEVAVTQKQALEDASVIDHLVRVFSPQTLSSVETVEESAAQGEEESYRLPPTAIYDQIRRGGIRRDDGLRALLLGE
ncbi:MAG TPA: hypothetical protein VMC10_16765 [Stellaceae bacterium]|nr:hypothetical protein [Stellaceae bacterium]